MLLWGIQHIAENHNFKANVEDWECDGQVCIFGGCNVPTLMDTMLKVVIGVLMCTFRKIGLKKRQMKHLLVL